jgi:DNA-binding LacI/PurR family transcriptional regulator
MTVRRARGRRATIMDVARAAEVSRQTVSNVVNNPHRVAPATLVRVGAEINRLGFRPSLAARSLRQERANALGVELNSLGGRRLGDIRDVFLVELTIASRPHDSHLVPFAAADHECPIPAYDDLLASKLVDAFILTDTRRDDPRPRWLQDRGIPLASFGRVWDEPEFTSWVDVDGFAGVTDGVRHLLGQGYSRVGFLGWPQGSPVGDDRRAGWVSATTDAGVHEPAWQAQARGELSEAAEAAAGLIDAIGPGGALVCASDVMALGAWIVLRDKGMAPGTDFGLVGFDDSDLAASFGLTSVRQPLRQVAENILSILEHARLGGPLPARGTLYRPTVIPRRSTDRLAAQPASRAAGSSASDHTNNGGNE